MQVFLRISLILIGWCSFFLGHGQNLSNRGREFWLGYGFNYSFRHENPVNGQDFSIYISAEKATQVTVSISNTTFSKTISIPANTVDYSVIIPKGGADDARILGPGLMNRAICIKSTEPIAVYSHQYNTMVSGASMLIPKEAYGFTYYSVNYAQYKSGSTFPYDPSVPTANGPEWYSWFFVVASEDGTRVQITPSDTTTEGWLPGSLKTLDLKKGEIYTVFGKLESTGGPAWTASKDMTGSKIVSITGTDGKCHPIAVYSGSGGIRLCRGDGGENMAQQMFPARAWGTRYLTYHMINNFTTNVTSSFLNFYRVCVMDPTTVVKRNGVPLTGLINNFYYEFSSDSGDYIESDKPILVSQYTPNANQCIGLSSISYGDPEMIYLSPIEQAQKSILFYTPRKSNIDFVYTNIYIPTSGVPSLRADDAPIPPNRIIPHPTLPGYSIAVARFTGPAATHTIKSDSAFNAYVHGIAMFESYVFTAGTQINDLTTYSSIRNIEKVSPAPDTITCPKTPFRAEIKVAYELTSLKWHLSEVNGLNPSTDVFINNPVPKGTTKIYGRNYFIYSLDQDLMLNKTGDYIIPFSYTSPDIDHCGGSEKSQLHVVVKSGPLADFDTLATYCSSDTILLKSKALTTGYNIISHRWDFNDGTFQSTQDAKKRFPDGGLQPVRYRLYTDNGCVGDTIKRIKVLNRFTTDFDLSGKNCEDSVLTFQSNQGISAFPGGIWHWNLGSSKSDSSRSQSFIQTTFKTSNTPIKIKHWIITDKGCVSDTSYRDIPLIHASAQSPTLSMLGDTLCPGKLIKWDASVSFTPSNWLWDLGDGISSSTAQSASRTYQNPGNYSIRLHIQDQNGCGAPAVVKQVTIAAPPKADAGPDQYVSPGRSVMMEPRMSPPTAFLYQWTPSTGLDDPRLSKPTATPITDISYAMKVWDKLTLCYAEDSVRVIVVEPKNIPNTFTPNNDGINDLWELKFIERCPECRAEVYATNGLPVWRSTPGKVIWDGRANGKDLPVGTYYYVIKLAGTDAPVTGYVTILR
jgi:gliding motility-associated-like protein